LYTNGFYKDVDSLLDVEKDMILNDLTKAIHTLAHQTVKDAYETNQAFETACEAANYVGEDIHLSWVPTQWMNPCDGSIDIDTTKKKVTPTFTTFT